MTKIATWNVNSLKVRLNQVLDWLDKQQPDILALQETKIVDEDFPVEIINQNGYQVIFSGQKTYNGVAILSKVAAHDVISKVPHLEDTQRRILGATFENIRLINLYVPNGEAVDSEKYQYKLQWLQKVNCFIESQLQLFQQVVVLGDFNIAPTDADVREPEIWQGKVLCSEQERTAFQALLGLGLTDTFRVFEQPKETYSWWDYRMLAFRRNRGLRIDHILATNELATRCVKCVIDKNPRKLERPSDHAPVLAEFAC